MQDVVLRARRESEGFLTVKNRPLEEKLNQLFDWILGGMACFTTATDEPELIKKLYKLSIGFG